MTGTVITSASRPGMTGDAVISEDGLYRYVLNRRWDQGLPVLPWTGLNPSTADGKTGDHTIGRMCFYAVQAGYGGICVLNLYALRSPDPAVLARNPAAAVGPDNDRWLAGLAENCRPAGCLPGTLPQPVVLAWGAHPLAAARVPRVLELLAGLPLLCLGTTRSGAPRHPARLGNDVPLVPWMPPGGAP